MGVCEEISLYIPQACPYFATRGIKEEAHIVFCPYNYLIDPLIRDQVYNIVHSD